MISSVVLTQTEPDMAIRRKSEDATINLTPMIDVVFLLVIFFMVGSKYSESESRVNVNVAGQTEMQAISRLPDQRVVEVQADGATLLDGQSVTLDQLVQTLQQQYREYPGLKVVVRGEGQAPFNRVNEVLRQVSRSGIADIKIAEGQSSRGRFH